ncbi:MAG: tetratricopeptide repeat protein [Planctomycetota bacterium]
MLRLLPHHALRSLSAAGLLGLAAACATQAEDKKVLAPRPVAAQPADDPTYEDTYVAGTSTVDAGLVEQADAAYAEGDWARSVELFRQVVEADPHHGHAWASMGSALHRSGKLDEALEAHQHAALSSDPDTAQMGAYNAACVFAMRREHEPALEWLVLAIDHGQRDLPLFENDSDLDYLRTDPRFEQLLTYLDALIEKEEAENPPEPEAEAEPEPAAEDEAVPSEEPALQDSVEEPQN